MNGEDEAREERIIMEAVVDAYGPEERAMGWYYYLKDKILFPFAAVCIAVNKRTPLELGEQVMVEEMSGEDLCESDMYVDILWKDKILAVPLSQLKPLDVDDVDEDTVEAVGDWHYWKKQRYRF